MVAERSDRAMKQVVRMCGAWLVAACLVTVPVAALAAGFPCEDVNGDGQCQAGVDRDVSADVQGSGMVSTSGDIVIPADAKGLTLKGDLALYSDGKVTINGDIKAQSISISGNTVVLGDGASVRSVDYIDLFASNGLTVGAKVTLQSGQGVVWVSVMNGGASFGEKSKVNASDLDFMVLGGPLSAGVGARWRSDRGFLNLYVSGDVTMPESVLEAWSASVYTESHLIDLHGSTFKGVGDGASISLVAEGSTIDLRGADFKKLDPSAIYISAETILQ